MSILAFRGFPAVAVVRRPGVKPGVPRPIMRTPASATGGPGQSGRRLVAAFEEIRNQEYDGPRAAAAPGLGILKRPWRCRSYRRARSTAGTSTGWPTWPDRSTTWVSNRTSEVATRRQLREDRRHHRREDGGTSPHRPAWWKGKTSRWKCLGERSKSDSAVMRLGTLPTENGRPAGNESCKPVSTSSGKHHSVRSDISTSRPGW